MDDQQPGTSRQLMFSLSPTKTVNPPSIAAVEQEESQHNTLWRDSQCTPVPADPHTTAIFTLSTSTSIVTSAIFHSSRTVKTSQPVQPAKSAQMSRSACTSHTNRPFYGLPESSKNNHSAVFPQNKKAHHPTLTLPPNTRKKLCE